MTGHFVRVATLLAICVQPACPSKHVQTKSTHQEAEKAQWHATTAAESKHSAAVETKRVEKRKRRTTTYKPDGTVVVDEDQGEVATDTSSQSASAGAVSHSASATVAREAKGTASSEVKRGGLPWWLWTGGALSVVAAALMAARKLLPRYVP